MPSLVLDKRWYFPSDVKKLISNAHWPNHRCNPHKPWIAPLNLAAILEAPPCITYGSTCYISVHIHVGITVSKYIHVLHIYLYISMYLDFMYTHMCIYIYLCIHVYLYMYVYIYICITCFQSPFSQFTSCPRSSGPKALGPQTHTLVEITGVARDRAVELHHRLAMLGGVS